MENVDEVLQRYEKKKEYMKEWRQKNKEKLNEKARELYNEKKEKVNERRRELYELKKEKKHEYYVKNKDKILELRGKERERTKNTHLVRRYGITLQQYNEMLHKQDSKCYICKIGIDETAKKTLVIDHCHSSGNVRKLLCNSCNTALGLIKESKDTLNNMINYLNEHKQ